MLTPHQLRFTNTTQLLMKPRPHAAAQLLTRSVVAGEAPVLVFTRAVGVFRDICDRRAVIRSRFLEITYQITDLLRFCCSNFTSYRKKMNEN